jgi:hypothetical protein
MSKNAFKSRASVIYGLLIAWWLVRPAFAQMSEVVVIGVTPTCPYGIGACAVGAREALQRMDGVGMVSMHPDRYNSTFDAVFEGGRLPDLERWEEQFRSVVGDAFVLRGVEVTVNGSVVEQNGRYMIRVEGLDQPLKLAPLKNKLQWNFRKSASREPEPAEAEAYEQLIAGLAKRAPTAGKVEIVGPLRSVDESPVIEVREYFISENK